MENVKNKASEINLDKKQIFIGFGILAIMIVFGVFQYAKNYKLALHLIIGLTIGYVMQRSRLGFGGAIRKPYVTGDSSLTKALLFMFSITVIITGAIHYGAFVNGADVAFRAYKAGVPRIPGTGFVQPASLATVIGGILFGIGMMFGSGCASGTLVRVGKGEGSAFFVLFFFCTGALWGAHDMPWWQKSIFFKINKRLYLPDAFGFLGAILISLLGYLLIYIFVKKYEDKRRRENTLKLDTYADWEKPLPVPAEYKFFSKETYHKFFVQRWSFYTGAVCLTIMFATIILTTGTSWGVTAVFSQWGAWFYQGLGAIDISDWKWFAPRMKAMKAGFLNDTGSMRNMGIIIGAFIAPLLAGRYSFKKSFKLKDIPYYAIGGLLMGYGARIALGCNIGALYSGLSNMSLSGWVFMPALTIGGLIGVKLVQKIGVKF